jgi:hypothetical protein
MGKSNPVGDTIYCRWQSRCRWRWHWHNDNAKRRYRGNINRCIAGHFGIAANLAGFSATISAKQFTRDRWDIASSARTASATANPCY